MEAWLLAEGDVLAGGESVLLVQREPVAGVVAICADDGSRRTFAREERVMVACRPAWRVPGFVAGLLPGRSAAPLPAAGVAPAWVWAGPGVS